MKNVRITTLVTVILVLLSAHLTQAQITPWLLHPSNTAIRNIADEVRDEGIIFFKCDSLIPGDLFTRLKYQTGLTINDSMVLTDTWQDSMAGIWHKKYQQFHKGIKVEGGSFKEHYNNNYVLVGNGRVIENINISDVPVITESGALGMALATIQAEEYAWQGDSLDFYWGSDSAQLYPHGEVVYTFDNDSVFTSDNYRLAWKFDIISVAPVYQSVTVYVNALTGVVLKTISNAREGSHNNVYYGFQGIDTRWSGTINGHVLWADDNNRHIRTTDRSSGWSWGNGFFTEAMLPSKSDGNFGNQRWAATAAHYVVTNAWDYWANTNKRKGLDGNGSELHVLGQNSAGNTGFVRDAKNLIQLVNTQGVFLATFDIAGHEFTHGVNFFAQDIGKTGTFEARSLDESFCDIFGVMAERNQFGAASSNWNWTLGEITGKTFRSLSNPSSVATSVSGIPSGAPCNFPATYPTVFRGTNFYTPTSKTCGNTGVHINGSVQNYCFYLLANGGTQLGITVNAVGADIAARVACYAFMNLAGNEETFAKSREHWITAARILYGRCSFVETETCKAWAAVGVGQPCQPCAMAWACWNPNQYAKRAEQTGIDNGLVYTGPDQLINVYPNPANNEVNIEISGTAKGTSTIRLMSIEGKVLIRAVSENNGHVKLPVETLSPGVYLVQVETAGHIQTVKLMKK